MQISSTSHIPSTAQQTLNFLWKTHHSMGTSATWMEMNLLTLHGKRYVVEQEQELNTITSLPPALKNNNLLF